MPPPGSDTADMGYSDLSFALNRLRKKGMILVGNRGKYPSGAKAHVYFELLVA
jgi:hypothetical protein